MLLLRHQLDAPPPRANRSVKDITPFLVTALKRSLRRLYFYTCLSVQGGGVSIPASLAGGIPACLAGLRGCIPACLAGFQAHIQGGSLRGLAWGGGVLQAHTLWVSRSTPGEGVSRPTPRGVYPSMHWGRLPPADSYCCGQYASYWNAFLF